MTIWEILALAVALGCDAFVVGLAVGARFHAPRQVFRLSFHFGLFQFIMPLIGWRAGGLLLGVARDWAPWLAFGLLASLGLKMAYDSLRGEGGESSGLDPTRGLALAGLSLATSMDALGVGLSLGLVRGGVWQAATVIGLVAGGMTLTAMHLGRRLSQGLGKWVGAAGGLILVGIAVKIVAG